MRIVNLEEIKLYSGAHEPDGKMCAMELAAYIAEEPWGDHPKCVAPTIATFMRNWNDSLNDDDRQMLKPYVAKCINTVGTEDHEASRAWLAIDWLARECAPAFLRLAGLTVHADTLEYLAALDGVRAAERAQPSLAAARDAAWVAARVAAGDAAWAAAWAAARDAAGAAARDAAWDAALDALQPTVKVLQASALLLLDRMIVVSKDVKR